MSQLQAADFLPAFDGLIPAFPAHSLTRKKQVLTKGGAWLVEHQEAQHRRFHSFLLYDQDFIQHTQQEEERQQHGEKVLDGYYMLNCAKLDEPQDICSIDISNQGLNCAKEDDFDLFTNLFHINAAENNLKLESLSAFPMVREIQFQFNGLSKVKLSPGHFPHLDTLDLSYNQVSHSAILNIGLLDRLRVLVLTANEIKTLPSNMAYPAVDSENIVHKRFSNLEELYLDDNHLCDLSTFATLGALKKLKYLNLSKNHIYYIPHLRVLGSAIAHVEDFKMGAKSAKSLKSKSLRSTPHSQRIKDEISTSEFGLTKSKLTPLEKTLKKYTSSQREAKSPLTSPDESPISDVSSLEDDEEKHGIRDDKPESRETPEFVDTPDSITHGGAASGGSIKSGMVEREGNKSESPDAIKKNKLNVESYLISERQSTVDTTYQTAPMPLQQPFPELQTLILSNNVISEEEGVLACALWPKLCQLVLHNNPVISQCRGLPILLTHELTLRNGITIIRSPPASMTKPAPVTASASTRRVTEPPRALPRQPHPELLALENAPMLSLPPTTAGTMITEIPPSAEPLLDLDIESEATEVLEVPEEEELEDGVFLTQVEDQEAEEESVGTAFEEKEESEPDIISYTASTEKLPDLPDKYKGFEDLVDVDDDPDDYIPEHIQAAVFSLRKALEKTMVLPDIYKPVCNSERLPIRHKYRSCKGIRNVPVGKKVDKDKPVGDGLGMMKTQMINEEGGLDTFVASKEKKMQRKGQRLLDKIQQRYNKVRSECLQQRSALLQDVKGTDPSLDSSFSLEQIAPSLSILPRTRTQASTYDSDRISQTPYREEDQDDSLSRESSQYTV